MQGLIVFGKIAVGLFWLAVIGNLVMPLPAPYATWLSIAGLVSLAAHVGQSWMFARHNKRSSSRGRDLVQILLFGAVHLMSVRVKHQ
jgi:uncharacterized protein YhhL (DUF1145 family)